MNRYVIDVDNINNNVKIVVIGDPHFKVDNIEDVTNFIEKLEQLVVAEQPDLCVVLGDVLHTHEKLFTEPMNKAYEMVKRLRDTSHVMLMVGNHDYINNQQFLSNKHWMNCFKEWQGVTVVDRVVERIIKDRKFIFVPYVAPGRFLEALNTISFSPSETVCIFAHQEFFGCKMGSILSVEGDKWPENYPQVVSGHIHSKQTLHNVHYVGSSMQTAFGESEDNVIAVLSWGEDDIAYAMKEVDLELRRKRIVYTNVIDIEDMNVDSLHAQKDDIRLSIDGDYEEFKAFKKTKKYKDLEKSGVKIVHKNTRKEKKRANEQLKELATNGEATFHSVLQQLILKHDNPILLAQYEFVVNNKILE